MENCNGKTRWGDTVTPWWVIHVCKMCMCVHKPVCTNMWFLHLVQINVAVCDTVWPHVWVTEVKCNVIFSTVILWSYIFNNAVTYFLMRSQEFCHHHPPTAMTISVSKLTQCHWLVSHFNYSCSMPFLFISTCFNWVWSHQVPNILYSGVFCVLQWSFSKMWGKTGFMMNSSISILQWRNLARHKTSS